MSPNSIAERSTRYVADEEGILCRPHWLIKDMADAYNEGEYGKINNPTLSYLDTCKVGFDTYNMLIKSYSVPKQDARGVLPLDTATKCVYTYSVDEWRHILDLRYYNTTGISHPNCKLIAGLIRDKLIEEGYEFR